MQGLRRQYVADGGYRAPRYPQAVAYVVSCDVVHHQPEEWHERLGAAAGAWLGQLRNGLDVAAQAAAMVRPGRDRLAGEIEVDETYVGGHEEGKRGRQVEKKSIVVVAAEKNVRAIGRIRLKRVKDVSAESLLDFIRETVEPGATIHTDGWKGYAGLPAVYGAST